MKSILGIKVGMTQVFGDTGITTVTVVDCSGCAIIQRKTSKKDGYSALQLGITNKKAKRTNKPEAGHFKKAGIEQAKRYVQEVRVPETLTVEPGTIISPEIFTVGEAVCATGTSIGKGFQGTTKRYNFSMGPAGHGSKNHRISGSMGALDRGGQIPKGKKKPGRMGNAQVTITGLKIVDILTDQNVILVSGAIPGPKNGLVVISNRKAEYDAGKITTTKKEEAKVSA